MKKSTTFLCFVFSFLASIEFMHAQTPAHIPTNGLVAYWPFSGNAMDSSGNNLHGIVNGASLSTDRNGTPSQAYYFNGISNHISVPYDTLLDLSQQFSISVWTKADQIPHSGYIIAKGCEPTLGGNLSYRIYYEGNYLTVDNWTPNRNYAQTNYGTTDTSWINFVYTYSGSQIEVFKNGTSIKTLAASGLMVTNLDDLIIGARAFGTSCNKVNGFKGKIDDLGIWNRVLTYCEINDLYHATDNSIASVSRIGTTLTANTPNARYQWLVCPLMTPLPGDTNRSLTSTSLGKYAVIVAKNGCKDTSNCFFIGGPGDFITSWKTDNPGTTNNNSVLINTGQNNAFFNFAVDWENDGIWDTIGVRNDIVHTYPQPGIYTIRIAGIFESIKFGDPVVSAAHDGPKLLSVDQWGDQAWQNLRYAFKDCSNMQILATDTPNLSLITRLDHMFDNATAFNSNINHWDVSNVTDLNNMFLDASSFNQPLNNWDVSNVTNMESMFFRASSFDQPLNNWDVSSVTNMMQLFTNASSFDQNINSWDVDSVNTMHRMFAGATVFNQAVDQWNVSNVTDMRALFARTYFFNQDLSSWDVSNVTDFAHMFMDTRAFNQDISMWDVSSAQDMSWMFKTSHQFNYPLNTWDVSNNGNFSNMFRDSKQFNQPLDQWDLSNGSQLSHMFYEARAFDQNLGSWDFKRRPSMQNFLSSSSMSITNYDSSIIGWYSNPNNLYDSLSIHVHGMKYCASKAARDSLITKGWVFLGDTYDCMTSHFVTTWKTDNTGSTNNQSIQIPIDPSYAYNYDVDWDNDGVFDTLGVTTSLTHQFPSAGTYTIRISGLFPSIKFGGTAGDRDKLIGVDQWGNQVWRSLDSAFFNCHNITYVGTDAPDLRSISSLISTFHHARKFNSPIGHWDMSTITSLSTMFWAAYKFNQPVNSWDVSNVTNMYGLFHAALDFNQPLDLWDVSKVTSMHSLFVQTNFDQDLSNWDVSSVTNFNYMFLDSKAFDQDISMWDVSSAQHMSWMFKSAVEFNQPLNSWDVSNVTHFNNMFRDSRKFNQALDQWDVSNGSQLSHMFYQAQAFDQNIGSWDFKKWASMQNFLSSSAMSITNYDSSIIGWYSNPNNLNDSLSIHVHGMNYCASKAARDSLITKGWIFIGDAYDCMATHFVTTWKTNNPGGSNSSSINIPTDPNFNYNYDVDWDNDGIFDTLGVAGPITHQYINPGTYTIRIRGLFPSIKFNSSDRHKLIGIDQWGTQVWKSLTRAFLNCDSLIYSGADAPNLSSITSLNRMFRYATSFNGALDHWDLSGVTDISFILDQAWSFNQPLNNWDVSNVTNMDVTFWQASSFNHPLDNWDVSNVTHMYEMFYNAFAFDQDLSNWDVSNVTTMQRMFGNAQNFDQNLGDWDLNPLVNAYNMLDYSGLSVASYDSTLIEWQAKPHPNFITIGVAGLKYCQSDSARNELRQDFWSFIGDSLDPACILTDINDSDDQINRLPEIRIYPNPSSGMVNLELKEHKNNEPLLIYNQSVQLVRKETISNGLNHIDLSNLPNGIYLLRFGNHSQKIIISH